MAETQTTEKDVRLCKDCGAPIGPGREDRQYCDAACKTNYNNRRRKEQQPQSTNELPVPDYITKIQNIILQNRKILEGLCDGEKPGRIRMRDLVGNGFNLKFFTSEADPTETGNVYRFCFEYGYRQCEDGSVIIIRREREVD